jgi:hypothetical protein
MASAAFLSVLQLVFEWWTLPETCREASQAGTGSSASASSPASPLAFLRLFYRGRTRGADAAAAAGQLRSSDLTRSRALATILALQCAIDGKLVQEQIGMVQMLHQRWSLAQRSLWSSAFGGAIILGGQLTGRVVAALGGEHPFQSLAHAASVLSFLCFSRGLFWLGLVPMVLAQQRRTPTITWLLAECKSVGVGRGEMIAYTANLRAAVETVGPFLYGLAQRRAARQGRPAEVFYAPMFLAVLAEASRIIARRAGVGTSVG